MSCLNFDKIRFKCTVWEYYLKREKKKGPPNWSPFRRAQWNWCRRSKSKWSVHYNFNKCAGLCCFWFFFEVPYSAIMKLSVQIKDLQILFYWIAGLEGHQQNYVLSLTFFLLWLAFKLLLFKVLVTQWPFLGKTTYSFCFQWIYCCAYVAGAYGDSKLDLSFTLFSIQSIYSALKIC